MAQASEGQTHDNSTVSEPLFHYSLGECAVQDKALLSKFREKYTEWFSWYNRDPYHNISAQIQEMMCNDAVYRAMNEARFFASERKPTAAINGMLGNFLDQGFVASQILAICKITDKSPRDPRKAVISLHRFIDARIQLRNA